MPVIITTRAIARMERAGGAHILTAASTQSSSESQTALSGSLYARGLARGVPLGMPLAPGRHLAHGSLFLPLLLQARIIHPKQLRSTLL